MQFSPLHGALLSYALLSMGMFIKNGSYSPWALLFVLASFVILCTALYQRNRTPDAFPLHLATFVLLTLITLSMFKRPVLYSELWFRNLFFTGMPAVFIGVVCLWMPRCIPLRAKRWIAAVLIAFGLLLRILIPIASPHPRIDVYNAGQESVMHLLEGLNPYTTSISGAFLGGQDFGYTMVGYFYPPAALYLQTIGYVLFGDVRYSGVLFEAMALGALMLLLRRASFHARTFLPLLLLFHPRGLFVIDQAWIDPLVLGLFGIFLLLQRHTKAKSAAVIYGFLLSLKQSLVFFFVHWLLIERRPRIVVLALLTGMLTLLPFAVWDFQSLWHNGIVFQLTTAFRPDALTVFAPLHAIFGIEPGKGWSISVGAIFATVTWLLFRQSPQPLGYLSAVTLTTFGMFLFGAQAFCNYYYLVCGLMLFLVTEMVSTNSRGRGAGP